jgi:hypothetical protein
MIKIMGLLIAGIVSLCFHLVIYFTVSYLREYKRDMAEYERINTVYNMIRATNEKSS